MSRKLLVSAICLLMGGIAHGADFTIDRDHAFVLFKIKHVGIGYVHGRFNNFSGSFTTDADDKLASVSLRIRANSVDTGVVQRDSDLNGATFLNTAQYPTIEFASTAVTQDEESGHYTVVGNMTLHGVTREVSAIVKEVGAGLDPWDNYRMGGEGTFTISRSDFGMVQGTQYAGDEIVITLAFEGVRR